MSDEASTDRSGQRPYQTIMDGNSAKRLPPTYMQAIGRVAVLSAKLEHDLRKLIGMMASKTDYTVISNTLMADLGLSQLVERYEALVKRARRNDDPLAESMSTLLTTAKSARTRRNAVIHAEWFVHEGAVLQGTGVSNRRKPERRAVPLSELTETARDLEEAGKAAWRIIFAILQRTGRVEVAGGGEVRLPE